MVHGVIGSATSPDAVFYTNHKIASTTLEREEAEQDTGRTAAKNKAMLKMPPTAVSTRLWYNIKSKIYANEVSA